MSQVTNTHWQAPDCQFHEQWVQRRLEEEQARVDRILLESKALREAEEIRAHVAAARKLNETLVDPVPETDLDDWGKWACEQADRIDPVSHVGSFRIGDKEAVESDGLWGKHISYRAHL
ncbi:hypothetical protein [Neorhizobium galegae]|uniref:hypothetical protein n=1 Tax=Neorhizobium galegae TaxID=399 RepID=UPI0012896E6D|nr:hypothetical protein [Neorhizobium galegae]KAA9385723.1 hypothetical protein F4V88_04215 [Neorhizobium galegae]MCM2497336.1 hypothetical protein [Neorhizobium galegae]